MGNGLMNGLSFIGPGLNLVMQTIKERQYGVLLLFAVYSTCLSFGNKRKSFVHMLRIFNLIQDSDSEISITYIAVTFGVYN